MVELHGALIGCGYFAQNHMHAWSRAVTGAEIVCLCDADKSKALATAASFGISPSRCYYSVEEMLDVEKLDFCDIATQPASHKEIVQTIARHAKPIHIICQKPMAPTVEDAEAMIDICAKNNVIFMIHENFRWQPPLRAVKAAIESSGMGQPFWGNVSFRSCFDVYTDQPYLATDDRFIIYDLGVHLIDLARFFMGDIKEIYCRKQRVNPNINAEDCASMILGMGNGGTCTVDMSYFSKLEKERFPQTLVALEGPNGSCRLDVDYRLIVVDKNGTVSTTCVDFDVEDWMSGNGTLIQASVAPTQQHFIDCLVNRTTPETSGDDNIKTLKAMLAAYESAATNAPIQM
eukprot:m.791651 g.791651  ORF g.791651 m.791651 type:complete len:346 (-) comp23331_c0_seq8:532-1569(-)